MKKLISVILLTALAIPVFATDTPRKSPDFTVPLVDGKQIRLSQYRGKVVALLFILTTCPHCQHATQVLSSLQTELDSQGFQVIAAAINENPEIPKFIADFSPKFPVGIADSNAAREYMQLAPTERTMMPYLSFIDRNGNIRGQYTGSSAIFAGDQVKNFRTEIVKLLNEPLAKPNARKH
jgi:peroxiredoxin